MSEEKDSTTTTPKKGKKRRGIVIGVICVVLIAAGVGFWVWHEQPSFCNAICHTPMDKYAETYYSNDSTYGVTTHVQANKTCLNCHEAKIDEQISEGVHWVAGSYAFDNETGMLESRSEEYATQEFCLNESCHNMTLDYLKEKTSKMAWNVHDFSEHGETQCGSCHQMHSQSTIVCSECHKEATEDIPNGWTCIPYGEEK